MNLYLISQTENEEYDTYDSAVVCAPDVETARNISPSRWIQGRLINWEACDDRLGWASCPENVSVKLIGIADFTLEQGVVCASFNAG